MPARLGFTNHTIGYIVLDKTSVKQHREFIRRLRTKQLAKLAKRYFENSPRGAVILDKARQIVKRLIYDAYEDPGNRTYNLFYSFMVSPDKGDTADEGALSLFSDPDTAEAKTNPGFSYAAFFEEPDKGVFGEGTFIKPKGVGTKFVNYRPFFESLVQMMDKQIGLVARDAMMTAIFELCPTELNPKVK